MANVTAMENAKMWLDTAEAAMNREIYVIALYSMEMSVEIALKAVLVELGINVPKAHNIMNTLRTVFEEKKTRLPKEFVEKRGFILDTYNDLLELRPLAGYIFEVSPGLAPDSKKKTGKYMSAARETVELCGAAVGHLKKGAGVRQR